MWEFSAVHELRQRLWDVMILPMWHVCDATLYSVIYRTTEFYMTHMDELSFWKNGASYVVFPIHTDSKTLAWKNIFKFEWIQSWWTLHCLLLQISMRSASNTSMDTTYSFRLHINTSCLNDLEIFVPCVIVPRQFQARQNCVSWHPRQNSGTSVSQGANVRIGKDKWIFHLNSTSVF